MADYNRVTEKTDILSRELWVVSAEWRGGHDKRVIRLLNVHFSKSAAQADYDRLTHEEHNRKHGRPVDYDSGFKRHPLRHFVETDHETQ